MVIGHCITYMGIKIEQNDDLGKKSYTQFLIKNESILVEETFIDDFFSELKFFIVSSFKFQNIICSDQIQKSYIFYKRKS